MNWTVWLRQRDGWLLEVERGTRMTRAAVYNPSRFYFGSSTVRGTDEAAVRSAITGAITESAQECHRRGKRQPFSPLDAEAAIQARASEPGGECST